MGLTQAPTASPIPQTSLVCTSSGDPHFSMFAGLKHHFQGIGEFVLAASKDGHFQVNTCQQRWAGAAQQRTVNTMVAVRVPGCTIVCIKGENCSRVGECSVSVDVQPSSIVFPTGEIVSRGHLRSSAVSVKVPAQPYANNLGGLCGAYLSPYIGDSFTSSSGDVTAGFSGGPSGNGYDSFVVSFADTYKVNSSNSLFPPDHTCAPEFVTTTMNTTTAAPLPFAGCENLRAQAESACMAAGANFHDCMDDVGATCELDSWVNEAFSRMWLAAPMASKGPRARLTSKELRSATGIQRVSNGMGHATPRSRQLMRQAFIARVNITWMFSS